MVIEKTKYGWTIELTDPDPMTRYLPPNPKIVAALVAKATQEERASK